MRPDWRLARPDWNRGLTAKQRAAMLEDFAIRDRAFETPLARRLRKEQEEREREGREAREALEAERQRDNEHEALKLKAELASLRFELVMAEFRRKANFNQLRVPAGNPDGGQWSSDGGGRRGEAADGQSSPKPDQTQVAQYSIGTLIGQSRVQGRGWVCFYKFSFGTVMVQGPTNLQCQTWVPAAGVSHGKLIANDN